jgi:hypothetical protein
VKVAGHRAGSPVAELARSGIRVHSLGIARTDHRNSARSSAGGVEVDFSVPVKNAPYIPNPLSGVPGVNQVPGVDLKGTYLGVVQLGGAGAAGALQHQAGAGVPSQASTTGRAPRHHGHAGDGVGAISQVVVPATRAQPVVADPPQASRLALVGLSRDDLMTLYLVLAFGTAAIFLGWRGSVVTRRRSAATGRRR